MKNRGGQNYTKRNKRNYLKKRELKWKEILSIPGNPPPHPLLRAILRALIIIIGEIINVEEAQQKRHHMIIIRV